MFGTRDLQVALLEQEFETVVCEMAAGDILLFHCNTFHRSNPVGRRRLRQNKGATCWTLSALL